MTKLTLETDNAWTRRKIRGAIHAEIDLLDKALKKTKVKLQGFEDKYGKFARRSMYGRLDDMLLLEWEGELDTFKRLKEKLKSLKDIKIEDK